jgi:hydrogenase-4 component E
MVLVSASQHFGSTAFSLLSLISVGTLLLAFVMVGSRHIINYIFSFTGQAWLVACVSLMLGIHFDSISFYIVALVSVILRGIILPVLFYKILNKSQIRREDDTLIHIGMGLIVGVVLVIFSMIISVSLLKDLHDFDILPILALMITFSIMLIGFLMLVTRHHSVSKIIALLMIENGLFLGGQLLVQNAEIFISLIVIFDVLLAVISFQVLSGYLIEQVGESDNRLLKRLVG